jgi:hypothetical protein
LGYVIFNVLVAVLLYWGVRVLKERREKGFWRGGRRGFGEEEHIAARVK